MSSCRPRVVTTSGLVPLSIDGKRETVYTDCNIPYSLGISTGTTSRTCQSILTNWNRFNEGYQARQPRAANQDCERRIQIQIQSSQQISNKFRTSGFFSIEQCTLQTPVTHTLSPISKAIWSLNQNALDDLKKPSSSFFSHHSPHQPHLSKQTA